MTLTPLGSKTLAHLCIICFNQASEMTEIMRGYFQKNFAEEGIPKIPPTLNPQFCLLNDQSDAQKWDPIISPKRKLGSFWGTPIH